MFAHIMLIISFSHTCTIYIHISCKTNAETCMCGESKLYFIINYETLLKSLNALTLSLKYTIVCTD